MEGETPSQMEISLINVNFLHKRATSVFWDSPVLAATQNNQPLIILFPRSLFCSPSHTWARGANVPVCKGRGADKTGLETVLEQNTRHWLKAARLILFRPQQWGRDQCRQTQLPLTRGKGPEERAERGWGFWRNGIWQKRGEGELLPVAQLWSWTGSFSSFAFSWAKDSAKTKGLGWPYGQRCRWQPGYQGSGLSTSVGGPVCCLGASQITDEHLDVWNSGRRKLRPRDGIFTSQNKGIPETIKLHWRWDRDLK